MGGTHAQKKNNNNKKKTNHKPNPEAVYGVQWIPSNPTTLGTRRSGLIRGVATFQGSICTIKCILGLSIVVWIQGVATFQGSGLEGVHCITSQTLWSRNWVWTWHAGTALPVSSSFLMTLFKNPATFVCSGLTAKSSSLNCKKKKFFLDLAP